jgi:hypothetical protein
MIYSIATFYLVLILLRALEVFVISWWWLSGPAIFIYVFISWLQNENSPNVPKD